MDPPRMSELDQLHSMGDNKFGRRRSTFTSINNNDSWSIGNRVIVDPKSDPPQAGDWGLGNRMLPDRHQVHAGQAAERHRQNQRQDPYQGHQPAPHSGAGTYDTPQYYRARNDRGQQGGVNRQDVAQAGLGPAGSAAHYGTGIAQLRGNVPTQDQISESESKRQQFVADLDAQVQRKEREKAEAKAEKRRQDIQDLIAEARDGSEISGKALDNMGIPRSQWEQADSQQALPQQQQASENAPRQAAFGRRATPDKQGACAADVGAQGEASLRHLQEQLQSNPLPPSSLTSAANRQTHNNHKVDDLYQEIKGDRHRFTVEVAEFEARRANRQSNWQSNSQWNTAGPHLRSETKLVYAGDTNGMAQSSYSSELQRYPIDVHGVNGDQLDALLRSFLQGSA